MSSPDYGELMKRLYKIDYFSDRMMTARDEKDADLIGRLRAERREAADALKQQARDLAAARQANDDVIYASTKVAARARELEVSLAAARREIDALRAADKSDRINHLGELLAAARLEVTQWQEAFERTCDDIAAARRETEEMRARVIEDAAQAALALCGSGNTSWDLGCENAAYAIYALSAQPDPHKENSK